jgi:hypothetical protein
MPFRRNCSAAIPPAPRQDVAVNTASSGHDDRAGFVISLQPHLGDASSPAPEQCRLKERACKL